MGHGERRAEAVGRDETHLPGGVRIATARDEHCAEPSDRRLAGGPLGERQQRVARAAGTVGVQESAIGGRGLLGVGQFVGLAAAPCAQSLEEGAIGLLGRVRKTAAETVEQDRGPALDDGKRITPEAKSETEAEVGGRGGVRSLSRQVRRRVRHADADRIERLLELRRLRVDTAEQGLCVCDGRRAGEHGKRRDLTRQPSDEAASSEAGKQAEEAAERKARDPLDRLPIVRVAVQDAAERGCAQREGDADQRRSARQRPLELDGTAPASRAGGLEQRVGVGRSKRLSVRGGQERRRASVQDRFGRGHRDDEVGIHQRSVDPEATGVIHVDEVGASGVVHFHASVEPARELRVNEQFEISMAGAPSETAGHEERLPFERRPGAVELRHRRRDRRSPRVVHRTGDRQSRRLDDDRGTAATRNERLDGLAREREAQRVANRGRHVRDRLPGRRRSEHDVVLSRLHDGSREPYASGIRVTTESRGTAGGRYGGTHAGARSARRGGSSRASPRPRPGTPARAPSRVLRSSARARRRSLGPPGASPRSRGTRRARPRETGVHGSSSRSGP